MSLAAMHTPKAQLNLAGAALNQMPLDWQGNKERILCALAQAQQEKVDVLCFAELSICSYGCEDLFLSDHLYRRSWELLERVAAAGKGLFFVIGLPLRHEEQQYNVLALVDDGVLVGFYAKQHLAFQGVYYEPRWFNAWEKGRIATTKVAGKALPVGEILYTYKGHRIGFEICEDLWQCDEKRPAKRYAEKGIDLMLSAHASHFALGRYPKRIEVLKESSRDYDCTYVYVNVLGNDAGRLVYEGDVLFACKGKLVGNKASRFSFHQQAWASYTLDAPLDIKDSFADEKEEFTQAACLALYDYLRRSHAKGFVLSASGGADSSMCAVLVIEMLRRALKALGVLALVSKLPFLKDLKETDTTELTLTKASKQMLRMVYQGSNHSSAKTLEASKNLAKTLGADFIHWSIAEETALYTHKVEKALGRTLEWSHDDIALQNIQARARTPALWLLANTLDALLITTNNRNESSVGYATMDGDMAGGLAPLASLSKPFILDWLRWAEKKLPCPALAAVNQLKPSAELRPAAHAQTDEADLMPYDIFLAIEEAAVSQRLAPEEIFPLLREKFAIQKDILRNYIKRFFQLWSRSQWKRERLAPSFHLDAYGVDSRSWCRFPILSGGY